MLSYPITLDGVTYSTLHVMKLTRNFSVLDGPNAGRMMDGSMTRDIIGTFYNYSVEIDPDAASRSDYDSFYEAISAPVDSLRANMRAGITRVLFSTIASPGRR